MRKKIPKLLGVVLTVVLVASLFGFAAPVSAAILPVINDWDEFDYPVAGALGGWFYDPTIGAIGPMAESLDGTLYTAVNMGAPSETLATGGNGTAEWTCCTTYSPPYAAELVGGTQTGADYAALAIDIDGAMTLDEVDEFVYNYYFDNDGVYGPHMCFYCTVNADGTGQTADITGPEPSTSPAISATAGWHTMTIDDTSPNFFWYGSFATTSGIAQGTGTLNTLGTFQAADFGGLYIQTIQIEYGWWAPGPPHAIEPTYVDNVSLNGTCYRFDPDPKLLKSTDGGRSWSESISPLKYAGGAVVDMVCSSLDADILYVTDGNYIYKSIDAGTTFAMVANESLEKALMGDCGITICDTPITCLDVGYDANDDPVLFIGVRFTGVPGPPPLPSGPPSVLFIEEEEYPANWTDLDLNCWPSTPGGYTPYSIACEPGFATSKKTMVVVSNPSDPISGDPETHVLYTTGSVCGWYEVAELVWNCVSTNPFDIRAASRIAFPDDYADTLTLFVGVVAIGAEGGDVYSVTPCPPTCYAIDRNVSPGLGGCEGGHTNIISLDIEGDTDEASIIAGANDDTNVYCSADGGWTWSASKKDPTGDCTTYVLWVGDSALAATCGCECAVSLSCGETVCTYWNQISLIATDIDCVLDLDHSPGYLTESETLFMVTKCTDCCETVTYSVFRYVGDPTLAKTSTPDHPWERVFCTTTYAASFIPSGEAWIDWVAVSPDFNTTGAVFLANTTFDIFRSLDTGCSWARLSYPCEDIDISAWIVIDKETIIVGGAGPDAEGKVFKTTRHGARPWKDYVYDTTATNTHAVVSFDAVDGDIVLLGNNQSEVFISEDGAVTWAQVDAALSIAERPTWVAFDPDYTTNNTIYAAAGTMIDRCVIDTDLLMAYQTWYPIYTGLGYAWGIQTVGDTTLYVGDCGSEEAVLRDVETSGTIAIRYDCPEMSMVTCDLTITDETVTEISGYFEYGELVEIIEYNLYCIASGWIAGQIGIRGHDSGAIGWIYIEQALPTTCCDYCYVGEAYEVISSFLTITKAVGPTAVVVPAGVVRSVNADYAVYALVEFERLPNAHFGCCLPADLYSKAGLLLTAGVNGCPDSNVVWALGTDGGCCDEVWFYEDTLATPVIITSPADAATLVTTTGAILEWEALCDATEYEIYVSYICIGCPEEVRLVDECFACAVVPACVGCSEETCCYILGDLDPGTTYYWKVRVCEGHPTLSKWSDKWEFTTSLGAVQEFCSPPCGAQDIILTPNFSWDAVAGATSYEIQLSTDEDFATIVASGTATVNAWACDTTLDYDTTYYWRVRPVKDGVYGAWLLCLFTTEAAPEEPPAKVYTCGTCGLEFATEDELWDHWEAVHEPAPVETPWYIWVIIGIGAVLLIFVIVLIWRTRRAV